MEVRLPPEQEADLAALAESTGRSTEEVVREAVALWKDSQAQQHHGRKPKHTPAEAAARIRELRKGNRLPESGTI